MSYEATAQGFDLLTHMLEKRYQTGEPLHLTVYGKPKLHVLSFKPLAYEIYGMLRNRAPYMEGELALRGFLTAPHPSGTGATVYAGLQAGEQAYGFEIDGLDPEAVSAINGIARVLGKPNFLK